MKICVLTNEDAIDHRLWQIALEERKIESYSIVNLLENDWLEKITGTKYDLFLLKPPGKTELFKRLYDERVYLIHNHIDTPIYPSLQEILVYENKRFLRDWLMVNKLPHPQTEVFFDKNEATTFTKDLSTFPIVGKTNIGASGNGVSIIKDKQSLLEYIENAFNKGIKSKTGPKLKKGSIIKKVMKAITQKGFLKQRLKDYKGTDLSIQYHYIILQEFIPHDYEWRCVRIGDSFFAHKKIAKGEMASGTLLKGYDEVPLELMDFIKEVTDAHDLTSVAVDLFENNGQYYINEIQCIYGQSDPYQMLVNEKPGRYVYIGGSWKFEEGMFNTNESYDLRLEHALSLIS